MAVVRAELDHLGTPYVMFNQRRFAAVTLDYEVAGGALTGSLTIDRQRYALDGIEGMYARLIDPRLLPELAGEPPGSTERLHCDKLHQRLPVLLDLTSARVVNRPSAMGSNGSKPYQAQLIAAQGFAVPETLITNDPALVDAFQERHERIVFKSMSGVRSIVRALEPADRARLDQIRWCPTQFQAYVEGRNIRVHVIGEELFATSIASEAVDYRYAREQGATRPQLTATALAHDDAARCQLLAASFGLAFAGIDLIETARGELFCLEVNPSPAFSFYEAHTGQPIGRAVARYLAGT
jgi:glutathione synthase/RimK-type ligase-like ATP-grasp enzyme